MDWRDAQTVKILESVKGRPLLTALWKVWFFLFDHIFTPLFWLIVTAYIVGVLWSIVYLISTAWHAGAN